MYGQLVCMVKPEGNGQILTVRDKTFHDAIGPHPTHPAGNPIWALSMIAYGSVEILAYGLSHYPSLHAATRDSHRFGDERPKLWLRNAGRGRIEGAARAYAKRGRQRHSGTSFVLSW